MLAVLVMEPVAAASPASASRGGAVFEVEVSGLSSADPLDRRLAELLAGWLVKDGHAAVASEDRASLRNAEADLAVLATNDPERAMRRLRERTADWRLECGVQGAVSDAESVYGLSTYSARFEVSIALVRTIDGRVVISAIGSGAGRREGLDASMDAALAEAAAVAMGPVLDHLSAATDRARTGVELLFASDRDATDALVRLRERLPEGHRVEEIEGGWRVEPAPEDAWFRDVAPRAGWSMVDRSAGVRLMRLDDEVASSSRGPLLAGLVAVVAAGAWWFLRRRLGGAST